VIIFESEMEIKLYYILHLQARWV